MSFACVLHFSLQSSAFHLHVFQNMHPCGFPRFPPLSVSRPDTVTHARRTSQTLFREREKNALRMGRDLPSGLGISPVDRPSNFVSICRSFDAQTVNRANRKPLLSCSPTPLQISAPNPAKTPPCSPPFDHDRVGKNRAPFGLSALPPPI